MPTWSGDQQLMDEKQRFQEAAEPKAKIRPATNTTANKERSHNTGTLRQFVAAFIVNLLPFCFGTAVGWTSPMQDVLQSDSTPMSEKVTDEQMSWLGSLLYIGGVVGTLIWSRVADRWGRKIAGYAVSVPFIVGWTLILISNRIELLYVARLLLGMGGSGGFIIPPLYVGDMVHDSIRGTLGSFVILFLNSGVLFAYLIGEIATYKMFGIISLTIPFVFLVCFFFLPESPVWLWTVKRKQDAERSLEWFRGGNLKLVQEETSKYNIPDKKESVSYLTLFSTRGNVRGMAYGLSLFCWQQMCGILVILSFAQDIIKSSGSSISAGAATIAVGAAQLGSSALSTIVVDRFGRRLLLLLSYFMMGLALFVLGLYLKVGNSWSLGWLPSASLMVHVIAYALGAGPVPYVVISETLATNIRGLATSTFIMWGTALAFASVKIYSFLVTTLGYTGCYWFFAGWSFSGFIITWILIPETKGIPLNEILAKMNGEKPDDVEANDKSDS